MFDSLDEQMKQDDRAQKSRKEWVLEILAIAVLAVVVFVGLFFGVRMLE
jgi:flagellar biosynthesis/type III secretory pathway M-ring protein FliF/YscJ